MRRKKDMLNLEKEEITDREWWKQTRKEIEQAKEDFVRSGKIGGNPLGFPNDVLKKDVLKK